MLSKIKQMFEKEIIAYQQNMDLIEYEKIDKHIRYAIRAFPHPISLLDVGSGLCRFPVYARNHYPHLSIHCTDFSRSLSAGARDSGFPTTRGNVVHLPYADRSFHIVHCSHVIEHLHFPAVTTALDELFRVVKEKGLVIIRAPLVANYRFYDDIDHIRPYPPTAVLNYYRMTQQQKKGEFDIEEIDRWYTRIAYQINPYVLNNLITKGMNLFFKMVWNRLRIPFARPNNYGIVLRRLHCAVDGRVS